MICHFFERWHMKIVRCRENGYLCSAVKCFFVSAEFLSPVAAFFGFLIGKIYRDACLRRSRRWSVNHSSSNLPSCCLISCGAWRKPGRRGPLCSTHWPKGDSVNAGWFCILVAWFPVLSCRKVFCAWRIFLSPAFVAMDAQEKKGVVTAVWRFVMKARRPSKSKSFRWYAWPHRPCLYRQSLQR